jgi:hypothetical protein
LGIIGKYDMIDKELKAIIINQYIKELNCNKYTYENKITPELTQGELAEINLSIQSVNQKIQAIESEKTKIEEGE